MAVGQNQWYHFGVFGAPPILEPILVVGLNRMFTGGFRALGFCRQRIPGCENLRRLGSLGSDLHRMGSRMFVAGSGVDYVKEARFVVRRCNSKNGSFRSRSHVWVLCKIVEPYGWFRVGSPKKEAKPSRR